MTHEALTEDDGYRIADDPAPEVLRISAGLLDLIVRVPTQRASGRERTFVASYGEVTLIVEARDSESGEILARAAERSDLTQGGNRDLVEVSSTFVRERNGILALGLFAHAAEKTAENRAGSATHALHHGHTAFDQNL